MHNEDSVPTSIRWARLRFSVIGPLFASPPKHGHLQECFEELSQKLWVHPSTGKLRTFHSSTIERWYYQAKEEQDPLGALERKLHAQSGTHPSITLPHAETIKQFRKDHPTWSYQLIYDNLLSLAKTDSTLCDLPSYSTVCRYMRHRALERKRRRKNRGKNAEPSQEMREMRSFEVSHVHALWHFDFHEGSRSVLTPKGEWQKPNLLGILDDHSRLACHLQWYLNETTENLVHGFSQALQKRGLPRATLSDRGSAMLSAEFTEGLERLGIIQHTTLPYTPEQNAKQECFWAQVEGRLMAMLEGEKELTLSLLNEATQAWVEMEYNHRRHSEIGGTPLARYLRGPSVGRSCPSSEDLRRAFRTEMSRKQRKSDGTLTAQGVRFEVPSTYRTLTRLKVRVARWDLSSVDLVDHRTGAYLTKLYPLDKQKNADGLRRIIPCDDGDLLAAQANEQSGVAPLLRELMEEYAATGLPPAYIPKDDKKNDKE